MNASLALECCCAVIARVCRLILPVKRYMAPEGGGKEVHKIVTRGGRAASLSVALRGKNPPPLS